ncbi:BRO-N domain-containing protein [Vibrio vulnificus]|nr:BRO-like protein [Vibrio vulnificus]ELP6989625.1 BRO-like protein [Vibrio vulnificus]
MVNDLVKVCYEGESGSSDIRTCYINDILHISLSDIFVVLTKENRKLDERFPSKYIPNLIKSQLQDLDDDEFFLIPVATPQFDDEKEVFVTQPGLNRVMASDKSKAGKQFQRWLYHEVIPSLQKHGVYPPPRTAQGSALAQMAEIIAQNSRALADTIYEQEKLKQEVDTVKGQVTKMHDRMNQIEYGSKIVDNDHVLTVSEWFANKGFLLTSEKEMDILVWCENLSLCKQQPKIPCPSGERKRARFYSVIIEEANDLLEKSRG